MTGTTRIWEPAACTPAQLREFARLVRRGFATATDSLDGRIRNARWLGFYHAADESLGAIAALKAPTDRYRSEVFRQAGAPVSPDGYELELGWIYVDPAHRGNRVAEGLCRLLLARVPTSGLFATTRTGNDSMMNILQVLGFARAGKPYPRRDEELCLFLRPGPTTAAPGPGA